MLKFEEKVKKIDQRKVKHVLYLSNFIRSKGYPEVLEMARLEKKRVESGEEKKLHFDFAGKFFDETEEKFFFNNIKDNGIEDFVMYHGIVGGDKKRELLKTCDIFVLLTRYPNEGQPISILEAMGNGMMIVTTDHAGIPDIVQDGMNGIVVDKNNIDSDLIYNMVLNSKLKTYEEQNKEDVNKSYTQQIYVSDMRGIFYAKTSY